MTLSPTITQFSGKNGRSPQDHHFPLHKIVSASTMILVAHRFCSENPTNLISMACHKRIIMPNLKQFEQILTPQVQFLDRIITLTSDFLIFGNLTENSLESSEPFHLESSAHLLYHLEKKKRLTNIHGWVSGSSPTTKITLPPSCCGLHSFHPLLVANLPGKFRSTLSRPKKDKAPNKTQGRGVVLKRK